MRIFYALMFFILSHRKELQKQSASNGDPMKKIKNLMGMGGSSADDDDDN
jgi:hypothetical protein